MTAREPGWRCSPGSLDPVTRPVTVGICVYEVTAIITGLVPTVTELCTRHRVLVPLLLTTLAVHLLWRPAAPGEVSRA